MSLHPGLWRCFGLICGISLIFRKGLDDLFLYLLVTELLPTLRQFNAMFRVRIVKYFLNLIIGLPFPLMNQSLLILINMLNLFPILLLYFFLIFPQLRQNNRIGLLILTDILNRPFKHLQLAIGLISQYPLLLIILSVYLPNVSLKPFL